MRSRMVLLLIIAGVLFSGCLGGTSKGSDFTIPEDEKTEDDTSTVTDEPAPPEKATVPEYITGEYWVTNTTADWGSHLSLIEVIGEETVEGVPVHIIRSLNGLQNDTYHLTFLSKEDLSTIKQETYRQGELVSTVSYIPPVPNFHISLKVNDTFSYSGSQSELGKIEIDGVIQSYEKIKTAAGEFDTYKIKSITSVYFGTIESISYYSPEMKHDVYTKTTSYNKLYGQGIKSGESETELLEYGVPPKEAPDIFSYK